MSLTYGFQYLPKSFSSGTLAFLPSNALHSNVSLSEPHIMGLVPKAETRSHTHIFTYNGTLFSFLQV